MQSKTFVSGYMLECTLRLRLHKINLWISNLGKYIKLFMKNYFHKHLCHENVCNLHVTRAAKGF